jgi:DNA-binding HxlR family transcriptional regulator
MNEKDLVKLYRTFYILGDSTSLKILFELDRFGEKTFSQLRDGLNINPATLSKKLKILVQVGLIAPDKSHDHLRVFYTLHRHQKPLKRILDSIERMSVDI